MIVTVHFEKKVTTVIPGCDNLNKWPSVSIICCLFKLYPSLFFTQCIVILTRGEVRKGPEVSCWHWLSQIDSQQCRRRRKGFHVPKNTFRCVAWGIDISDDYTDTIENGSSLLFSFAFQSEFTFSNDLETNVNSNKAHLNRYTHIFTLIPFRFSSRDIAPSIFNMYQ